MTTDLMRRNTLDLLRFPLAIVVLSIHIFSSHSIIVRGEPIVIRNYSSKMIVYQEVAISNYANLMTKPIPIKNLWENKEDLMQIIKRKIIK